GWKALIARTVQSVLGLHNVPAYLWTDSTVTLGWIHGHPSRWKTYVANRVAEIQRMVPDAHWRHLTGRENPADCASPGILPSDLVTWWRKEIDNIKENQPLSRGCILTKLSPFVDVLEVLRVGGRIKYALLAYDEKHPMILPGESHFAKLVIEACHRGTLHGGGQATLGLIRQHYWIPRGRALVKNLIHRCVSCLRWRVAPSLQLMGDLPRQRVTSARPFLNTGVDYAGPMILRTTKGQGQKAYNALVAVFVCMSSRAVHLEIVSDYSSEAFLAALRRFVSRRGLCHTIYSDCGTNFVGADRQLRAMFAASSSGGRKIADGLESLKIQWRFNPLTAPHFGGLWEAAVKSMKHHLRRVLGESTLTYEEMATLLA
ncbi:PREDICTED: uncharacterized protein LOC108776790, partial [Cyphomyrmex costatus]|uniref:uncharacterized protein LOC108776790 n=1 Tax=Cyphomyrmex costatus TaxID=456900 RepID=UPI00085234EC